MTWRASARRVGQATLTVLACVSSFEVATRIDQWVRFGMPPWSPIAAEEELLTRDSLGEHGKPYAQFEKWTLNNVGMRGPDIAVDKPTDVLRVVTAGASETFGLYESLGQEYPRQLEDSLQSALRRDGCGSVHVQVLNAAIFGMTLPTIGQDLRMRVAPLHPDVVVLYPTPVQYLADSVPRPALPRQSPAADPPSWVAALRPRSLAPLREQLKEALPGWLKTWLRERDIHTTVAERPEEWRFTTVPADRLAHYDQDLRRVIGTIHGIGAAAVIMTHADLFMTRGDAGAAHQRSAQLTAWERFYPRATGAVLTAFDSAAVAITLRAAQDSSAAVFDLASAVRTMPSVNAGVMFADYAHFTDSGAALVAGRLTRAVLQSSGHQWSCAGEAGTIAAAVTSRSRSR